MAQPTDRASFITYCKQRLGQDVIRLELSAAQCDNAVDDALTLFREYHFDATRRTYLKHKITPTDLTNHYIPCSDDIMSVVRVVMDSEANLNIFDIRYQLRLQDFYNFSNVSMVHYEITMEKLALLDWMLNPQPSIEFTRLENKIYLNVDWANRLKVDDYLIFEVYQALGENTRIWQDKWLKDYTTALMRRQWGSNLKKFRNISTLGQVTLDGQQVYDEAVAEIEKLEQKLYNDYQAPPRIFLG